MQVSSKVLIDIPFDGIIKGDEKIIFLRKKDFSVESISLRIRNFLYGKKMKEAAANHVKNLLSVSSINQLPEVRQLSASIDEKKEVATADVIDIFMKIEHENQFNKLIGKPTTKLEIPEELHTIVNQKIEEKLTAELKAINKEENLPNENLNEIISLLTNIPSEYFDNSGKIKLMQINSCDLKNFPDSDDVTLINLMNSLIKLKINISENEASDYKNKIDTSIDKLITKMRTIIDITEKAKLELKNTQRKELLEGITKLLSKHTLSNDLKKISVFDTYTDLAFDEALFGKKEEKEEEVIKEYLTPLSHYLKFGTISINITSAPILEHLLANQTNFIDKIKDRLLERNKFNNLVNNNSFNTDYLARFNIRLELLKEDLKEFNEKPENEQIDQNQTLTELNKTIKLIKEVRNTLDNIWNDDNIKHGLTDNECDSFIDCVSSSEILKKDEIFNINLNNFKDKIKKIAVNPTDDSYKTILNVITEIESPE